MDLCQGGLSLRFFKKTRRRACVIGLDGVPCSLVRRFVADGTMPVMAELAAQGTFHKMKVSLPEISSVSWTSFMTGTGPGEHGIFGFIDLKPGSREMRFPNFRDVKAPTLWDRLGKKGMTSVVLNQPSTYPARPIHGAMVSGFVALDLQKAVFPARYFSDLKRANYELDIDTQRARNDSEYLIQSLDSSLEGRRAALDLFWDKVDWDYFQIVITGTDRLQHYLWNAIDDDTHPYHEAVRDYYRKVDRFIGRTVDRFKEKVAKEDGLSGLFLLSDHGFTGLKREFNLNTWLRESGYQHLDNPDAPSLNQLAPSTRAFVLDPSRIYLNRKDRFIDGCVPAEAVSDLIDEISHKLLSVRFERMPVVQRVIPCKEIYAGPQAIHGPDLIVLTHYGFDAKGALGKKAVFTETDLQGMHTWDDAFFWAGEKRSDDLKIEDLAPLIESALSP
ncbi:MAG: alkaline phosphatase family protein [Planctomycetota bacterium]